MENKPLIQLRSRNNGAKIKKKLSQELFGTAARETQRALMNC